MSRTGVSGTATGGASNFAVKLRPARRRYSTYLLRRLGKAIITIFVIISLTFFLIRLMPGNPVQIYINQLVAQYGIPYEDARNQAAALFSIDLDAPLYLQYFDFLGALIRGDLGESFLSKGTPVVSIIKKFLPWTLFSVGISLCISFMLGVFLGMMIAYRRESMMDHVLTGIASAFSSIPNYLIAILIVVFLGVQWGILPIHSMRGSLSPGMKPSFSLAFIKDVLFHAFLPILTYVLTTTGGWMLAMKGSTLSTMEEDYVTVAHARGLKTGRITTAYVGRNASLPLFTQLAVSIGFIVGGSALIESIFVYQGIGAVLANSIAQRDYPVMQGVFMIITISVVVANLLADFLYSKLDPRIQLGGGE